MKKKFVLIVFFLFAQISFAQDANFKADVLKLISISGGDAQLKVVKPQILNMIAVDKKENFSKEFDSLIPSLHEKIAKVYMEIYTPEDIKGMIAFYESPVGKKMSEKAAELGQKSMQAGEEWSLELQGIMAKYKDAVPEQNAYEVKKLKE